MKIKFVSEFLGTAFLLMIVVGSGIMGESLAGGNNAIALLVNSLATGAGLFVLIQNLGPISGANFNPIVSLVEALWGRLDRKSLMLYWIAQFAGAIAGVWLTHAIFHQEIIQLSTKARFGSHLWISEIVATFGLICTIALSGRKHVEFAPISIAAYVTSAYWFTSSTSFANPAVTVARMFTNTFCGIDPTGVFPFILAQITGALFAFVILIKVRNEVKST
ncbi:MAG: aquaporin family protein [Bacteriovorax sp.]|nr:aquaporin family protein [Bacteriovorax sp.]